MSTFDKTLLITSHNPKVFNCMERHFSLNNYKGILLVDITKDVNVSDFNVPKSFTIVKDFNYVDYGEQLGIPKEYLLFQPTLIKHMYVHKLCCDKPGQDFIMLDDDIIIHNQRLFKESFKQPYQGYAQKGILFWKKKNGILFKAFQNCIEKTDLRLLLSADDIFETHIKPTSTLHGRYKTPMVNTGHMGFRTSLYLKTFIQTFFSDKHIADPSRLFNIKIRHDFVLTKEQRKVRREENGGVIEVLGVRQNTWFDEQNFWSLYICMVQKFFSTKANVDGLCKPIYTDKTQVKNAKSYKNCKKLFTDYCLIHFWGDNKQQRMEEFLEYERNIFTAEII